MFCHRFDRGLMVRANSEKQTGTRVFCWLKCVISCYLSRCKSADSLFCFVLSSLFTLHFFQEIRHTISQAYYTAYIIETFFFASKKTPPTQIMIFRLYVYLCVCAFVCFYVFVCVVSLWVCTKENKYGHQAAHGCLIVPM